MPEEILAVDDIQGDVLPGFNTLHKSLLGFKFDATQMAQVRQWLAVIEADITTLKLAADEKARRRQVRAETGERPMLAGTMLNMAFSSIGLAKLDVSMDGIEGTENALFLSGMSADAEALGDVVDADHRPVNWIVGQTAEKTPDVMLIIGADDTRMLTDRVAQLLHELKTKYPSVQLCYRDDGARLPGDKEHFGFRDGVSQPAPRGKLSDQKDDYVSRRHLVPSDLQSNQFARPGQPLVHPGQFIFGYSSQTLGDITLPGPKKIPPEEWMHNGSFLVYRRLAQDVELFQTETARIAGELPGVPVAEVQAKFVGRWPDGTPLTVSTKGDEAIVVNDLNRLNHFDFSGEGTPSVTVKKSAGQTETLPEISSDFLGARCPRGAHVRQVNPRNTGTDLGGRSKTLSMQMLRRGIPYGAAYKAGEPAGVDRGLLFLAYQTSINQQFRLMNNRWMNNAAGPHDGGHDMIVGQNAASGEERQRCFQYPIDKWGIAKKDVCSMKQWVSATGGGYFFAPSRSAVRRFAAGPPVQDSYEPPKAKL